MAGHKNDKPQYVKLEQRLTLLAWLNNLSGYRRTAERTTLKGERA